MWQTQDPFARAHIQFWRRFSLAFHPRQSDWLSKQAFILGVLDACVAQIRVHIEAQSDTSKKLLAASLQHIFNILGPRFVCKNELLFG